MSFPIDGRNHRESVMIEKSMSDYKSYFELFYGKVISKIEHVGGTKTVVDFKIEFLDGTIKNKSLKKKKSLKNGSFDYVNISDFDKNNIKKSFDVYNQFKGKNNKQGKNFLVSSLSEDLVNMESSFITKLVLEKIIYKYEKIGGLDILETSTNTLYIDVEPNFFKVLKNGGYLKIRHNGFTQMSYMLDLFNNEGVLQEDAGLRIRLHLNNGWTKWYNGGSSYLVIKIQQDKVNRLIEN
jgi:hypothetical protein